MDNIFIKKLTVFRIQEILIFNTMKSNINVKYV